MLACDKMLGWLRKRMILAALAGFGVAIGAFPLASDQAEKPTGESAHENALTNAIDRLLRDTVTDREPGMAVIVEHAGTRLLRKGYGMADLELAVPIDPGMVFRIGSVTKQVTAVAIMKLVDRGSLSLEDPVTKHISGLPERFNPVRLKHLLSHTSGIGDYMQAAEFDTLIQKEYHHIVNEDLDLAKMFEIIAGSDIAFEPGSKYSYSNSNYFLLAMVLEEASGVPFFDFIKQEICVPAGMVSTYYKANAMLVPGRVPVHVEYEGQIIKNPHRCMGSILGFGCGGLWSTADDLARYNAALESGLLVSAETLAKMSTPFILNDGRPARYGLGWQTADLKGRQIVFHGGDYVGYSALILRVPSEEIFVAMLSNDGAIYAFDLEMPAKEIAAILFDDPFPDWKAIEMTPEALARYVGTYRIDESNVREFIVEDGRAFTQRNEGGKLEVFPASDTTFFYTVCLHYIEFKLDDEGTPLRMILHRDSGKDEIAEKVR